MDVLGLAFNMAGIISVAVSETTGSDQYLTFSGVSLAAAGMVLMYVGRFQKLTG